MAIPSFSNFEWLHSQPFWGSEPDYRTAIRTPRFERWAPLWRLLNARPAFTDYEIGWLLRLKDEYENGFDRRG